MLSRIIELIENDNDDDVMTLEELKEFLCSISKIHIKELREQLKEEIIERSIKTNTCPECEGQLSSKELSNNYGEYFGRPVIEVSTKLACQDCSWEVEDE